MSKRIGLEEDKSALKNRLDELFRAETSIAVGLLGIGVGIGWDDKGEQRFEVRVFSHTLDQSQLLQLRETGLPQNFKGLEVHYEIIRNVVLDSELRTE